VGRTPIRRPAAVGRATAGVAALVLAACGGADAPVPTPAATVEQELAVDCEADHVDHEDEVNVVYLVEPGGELRCTVTGLVPDVEARWSAQLFDGDLADSDEAAHEQHGVLRVADDEASFTTDIPADPPLLWLVTRVSQGEREAYVHGQTGWYWEGAMVCLPDPAAEGDTVECHADGMAPDELFYWEVGFGPEPDAMVRMVDGSGTTDERGLAVFGFEVPADERIAHYRATAEQRYDHATFEGEVRSAAPIAPEHAVAVRR
jgi:hypothetical protein